MLCNVGFCFFVGVIEFVMCVDFVGVCSEEGSE